jgi:Mrp family chromosome partitioning ATPase
MGSDHNNDQGGCGSCSSSQDKKHTREHADKIRNELILEQRLEGIRNKIVVLSGKGGVGKSTVAVNLALALAARGKKVGLLDVDVHGPSVPIMLGLVGQKPQEGPNGMIPVPTEGLKVMSVGFMLPDNDSAVIWRGPLKMALIEQFLRDVDWGKLDYLVIDAPPGTGDEPLSVCQLVQDAQALIVTTPQRVATMDVRKSVTFCRQMNMKIIGVVENMSGMLCPHCGELVEVFPSGQAEEMTKEMGLDLLARLPLDPRVAGGADMGRNFMETSQLPISQAMEPLVEFVLKFSR